MLILKLIPPFPLFVHFRQHRGAVTGVVYSPNGDTLYSACSQGILSAYTAAEDSYRVTRVLPNTVARGTHFMPDSLAMSPCGRKLAFVGPSDFTVTVVDSWYLSEVRDEDVFLFLFAVHFFYYYFFS